MSDVSMPIRVQRRRTKGWRMPLNTVYVGRPTRWGNPCRVTHPRQRAAAAAWFVAHVLPKLDVSPLRGKNLACWCPIGEPCHADALLHAANKGAP